MSINLEVNQPKQSIIKTTTAYHERKIGNTLYRVTSVYKGEIELKKALEDLTIRKILQLEAAAFAIK